MRPGFLGPFRASVLRWIRLRLPQVRLLPPVQGLLQVPVLPQGRGLLQELLRVQGLLRPLGPRAAVCVQAALFAVQHGGAAGIAYALVLGVLLGTIRQRTGRVWPGWALHTVNNLLVFAAG